jgi:hypothetical protein
MYVALTISQYTKCNVLIGRRYSEPAVVRGRRRFFFEKCKKSEFIAKLEAKHAKPCLKSLAGF